MAGGGRGGKGEPTLDPPLKQHTSSVSQLYKCLLNSDIVNNNRR